MHTGIYQLQKHFMQLQGEKKNNYGQLQKVLSEKVNSQTLLQIQEYIIKIEHHIIMQLNM